MTSSSSYTYEICRLIYPLRQLIWSPVSMQVWRLGSQTWCCARKTHFESRSAYKTRCNSLQKIESCRRPTSICYKGFSRFVSWRWRTTWVYSSSSDLFQFHHQHSQKRFLLPQSTTLIFQLSPRVPTFNQFTYFAYFRSRIWARSLLCLRRCWKAFELLLLMNFLVGHLAKEVWGRFMFVHVAHRILLLSAVSIPQMSSSMKYLWVFKCLFECVLAFVGARWLVRNGLVLALWGRGCRRGQRLCQYSPG